MAADRSKRETNILVVDDDEDIVSSVTEAIEHEVAGTQVRSSTSPSAALELAGPRRVDLLMTDLEMPDMDGIELTERIRAQWPTLQAVLVTGHDVTPDLWTRAQAVGVRKVLPKPFRVRDLIETVEEALDKTER